MEREIRAISEFEVVWPALIWLSLYAHYVIPKFLQKSPDLQGFQQLLRNNYFLGIILIIPISE